MKIRQKLILGFVVIALSIVIAEGIAIYYQNEIIKNNAIREINGIKYHFLDLEERDIKILSASLEVFSHNQVFKDVYLEKDREKLYNYGQPLFQNLRDKNGITHFYFILPDGHCFVRLHDKDIYGDLITRYTFCKARDTKNIAFGIELGKTAFALRVVMPYYNNSELIGYIEFGEEISHFLKNLKAHTNNEFAIFADKNYLNREEWKSVRQVAGLRDDWDDLAQHVIIADTLEEKIKSKTDFFVEKSISNIEKGKIFIQQVQYEKKVLAGGGFEIKDAGGRHVGVLLCLINITDNVVIAQKSKGVILSMIVILFIICLSISLFISHSILNPITKLMQATIKIGKGELNTRIKIESKDELGYLANSFNKMVENLEKTTISIKELNKEIMERKKMEDKLSQVLKEETKFRGITTSMLEDNNQVREQLEKSLESLKEAQSQLIRAEKMEVIGRMASGIAHEVKNPLGIILQGVNYFEGALPPEEKDSREILQMMKDGVKRADSIVRALLDFSRFQELKTEQRDINAIIESSILLVQYKLKINSIECVRELGKDLPKVLIDIGKIEQVFVNLFNNAADIMPTGGKLYIRSYLSELKTLENKTGNRRNDIFRLMEKAIIVEVEDTGPGIGEDVIDKIFDPFFTTKSRAEGTGLGLSVAKSIIDMHEGLINVKSEKDKGAKFTIVFKIAGKGKG